MNEAIRQAIERYSKVANLGEEWNFVKEALIQEQADIIQHWLGGDTSDRIRPYLLESDSKSKIWAINWLLEYIANITKKGEQAIQNIRKGDTI